MDTASSASSTIDVRSTIAAAFIGGSSTGPSGRCYVALNGFPASPPHVTYPFTSRDRTTFDRSVLPWSGRSSAYDISSDGVAHVGMIPDLVEELTVIGLSDKDLEPLWHGAEAYVRMWGEASQWAGSYTDETQRGVPPTCRAARAELISTDAITNTVVDNGRSALTTLRANSCKGAN